MAGRRLWLRRPITCSQRPARGRMAASRHSWRVGQQLACALIRDQSDTEGILDGWVRRQMADDEQVRRIEINVHGAYPQPTRSAGDPIPMEVTPAQVGADLFASSKLSRASSGQRRLREPST
jgi:hypothetical protein